MTAGETVRVAVRALGRNTLRSFLTALGIIIGDGAVIAMVAIGVGAKARVEQAFSSMGTNLLMVMPGSFSSRGVAGGFGSLPTLTWDDLKAIQTEVPSVRLAAPQLRISAAVMSEEQNWTTLISGVTPEYFEIRNWRLAAGNGLSASDIDTGNKVAVLGATVVGEDGKELPGFSASFDMAEPGHPGTWQVRLQGVGPVSGTFAKGTVKLGTDVADQEKLEVPFTVGEDGSFLPNVPLFAGKRVLTQDGKDGDANGAVIKELIARNALLSKGTLRHQ